MTLADFFINLFYAFIFFVSGVIYSKVRHFYKYIKIASTYDCYVYKKKNYQIGFFASYILSGKKINENYGSQEYLDRENSSGTAKIFYLDDNILKIEHTDNNNDKWSGVIHMETESSGTLIWRYDVLHGKNTNENNKYSPKKCGFKRVIIDNNDSDKNIIHLIGDKLDGYGVLFQV